MSKKLLIIISIIASSALIEAAYSSNGSETSQNGYQPGTVEYWGDRLMEQRQKASDERRAQRDQGSKDNQQCPPPFTVRRPVKQ